MAGFDDLILKIPLILATLIFMSNHMYIHAKKKSFITTGPGLLSGYH